MRWVEAAKAQVQRQLQEDLDAQSFDHLLSRFESSSAVIAMIYFLSKQRRMPSEILFLESVQSSGHREDIHRKDTLALVKMEPQAYSNWISFLTIAETHRNRMRPQEYFPRAKRWVGYETVQTVLDVGRPKAAMNKLRGDVLEYLQSEMKLLAAMAIPDPEDGMLSYLGHLEKITVLLLFSRSLN
jgi:hypothetical protein